MRTLSLMSAGVIAAAFGTTPARADALQAQLVAGAAASAGDRFAMTRTTVSDQTGSPHRVFVDRYDPRQPQATRWTRMSTDGVVATPKQVASARRANAAPPSYANMAKWLGAPAVRDVLPTGQVVYRYPRLPAGTLMINGHDASPDTRAEAVVNTSGRTPWVEHVRLASTTPFRMMMVVQVRAMTFASQYRQLGDGAIVPVETAMEMTGSLMGKAGQMRTTATFRDVTPVR